jgi:hypothetical protein
MLLPPIPSISLYFYSLPNYEEFDWGFKTQAEGDNKFHCSSAQGYRKNHSGTCSTSIRSFRAWLMDW